jgi:gliding motility-associated-like protein
MQKRIYIFWLLIIAFFLSSDLFAQKQGSIWYFGKNAGVDFRSNQPVALLDGQLDTDEGCATICDANGNLLFYTDGVLVWNRNHQVMPNGRGLGGDESATQSAIIVPHPGNTNEYYIFTVSSNLNGSGLRSSVVDMRLDNGLGDLVNGRKNFVLMKGLVSTEKITAVKRTDGVNNWIVAHPFDSDEFYIYDLSTAGLEVLSPKIQSIGTRHEGVNRNAHGYMKFSPDGKKLAVALGKLGIVELFDFDTSIGELSNPIQIPVEIDDPDYKYAYGVEFSPDNSKLYVSFRYRQGIDQYDLKATNLLASRHRIATRTPIGALQLAINGKIYSATNRNYLGIINQPDLVGNAVNYTEESKGLSLKGRESRLGLPNYITSYFSPIPFDVEIGCLGEKTFFSPNPNYRQNILSLEWDFGDSNSGVLNTSTEINPFHIYNQPGNYLVTLKATLTNGVIKNFQDSIRVSDKSPKISLGNDTTLCPGSTLRFDLSESGGDNFVWSQDTLINSPFYEISKAGKYWVSVSNGCGTVTDTIEVNYYDYKLELPEDRLLCPNEEVVLNASSSGAISYKWQDQSTEATFTVKKAGTYKVKVNYENGCSLERSVNFEYLNDFELVADTVLCRGDSTYITFKPQSELIKEYLAKRKLQIIWSNGAFNVDRIKVGNPINNSTTRKQLYWAVLILENTCTRFDDIEILFLPKDKPQQTNHFKEVCVGENVLLDATTVDALSYRWFNNTTSPTFLATDEGVYTVEKSNGNCSVIDTFLVSYVYPPYRYETSLFLCENQDAFLYAYQPNSTYLWEDGSTEDFLLVNKPGIYKVQLTNACGKDTVFFNVEKYIATPFQLDLGPNRILCPRDSVVLDPKVPLGYELFWQDGSDGKTFTAKNEGLYALAVISNCMVSFDTVRVSYKKAPRAKFNDDEFICENGSLDLDATSDTPGTTYKWFNSANQLISTQAKITVNQIGTYTVEIEYGCDKPAKYQAFVQSLPEALSLKLGEDRFLCNQEKIILDAGLTNARYLWQDGSQKSTFEVSQPGTYWVKATVNGCSITDTINVFFLEKLKVDLGEDKLICTGEALKLDASSANGSYQWYNENNQLISTDAFVMINQAGKYRVKVDNGCIQGEDSIRVSTSPLKIDLGDTKTACLGDQITLDATFNDNQATYLWSNNSTNPTLTVNNSGIYKVKVFLKNCVVEDSVQVKFLTEPEVNLIDDQVLCPQTPLVLNAQSTNGNYKWYRLNKPNEVISNQAVININEPDTYWVVVDNNCKIKSDTVKVKTSNLPIIDLGRDLLLCQGSMTSLNATTPNAISYQWFDINNNLLSQNSSLSTNQAGLYKVLVRGVDGCEVQDSILVEFKGKLQAVNLGRDTLLCDGNSLVLNANSSDPTATYLWQDGSTNAQFTVNQAGVYKVKVSNGCEAVEDEIKIDFKPKPIIDLGNDRVLCSNEVLVLDANYPNSTYLWQDGSTNSQFRVTQGGTYSVTVNLNGCSFTDQINIDYKLPLKLDLGRDTILCEGQKYLLVAGTDMLANYLWQDGSKLPFLEVSGSGLYSVTVNNGCEIKTDEIQINFIPQPQVSLPKDTVLCVGQTLTLDASNLINNVVYRWQDGSTAPQFIVTKAGKYWVEVQNEQCLAYDEINVLYEECLTNVSIPNVITPNLRDGKNDTFIIENLDLTQWVLEIFDRNGDRIYQSENYQNDWTGENQIGDVFYYFLHRKNGKYQFKGWLQVIR